MSQDIDSLIRRLRKVIDDSGLSYAELEKKIPAVMDKNCYVLHSDHSIPKTVNYEVYKYFIKKGLELGTYKD